MISKQYYSRADIERARHTDVVSFLIAQDEQVKRCGKEWEWRHNDEKVTINCWKWYNQYTLEHGNAVDFVMKYSGVDFTTAVGTLLHNACLGIVNNTVCCDEPRSNLPEKEFTAPERYRTMDRVRKYLCDDRCVSRDVVSNFAARGLIYEDAEYHNAVFLGCDEDGTPRHAHRRAAYSDSGFKCTVAGSNPEYSFHHIGTSKKIFVFEAPIDMLSFISMYPDQWQEDSYVALCSVSPRALFHMLSERDYSEVFLCLDNDDAGFTASQRITAQIRDAGLHCNVSMLTPQHKDWNEDLCALRQEQVAVMC